MVSSISTPTWEMIQFDSYALFFQFGCNCRDKSLQQKHVGGRWNPPNFFLKKTAVKPGSRGEASQGCPDGHKEGTRHLATSAAMVRWLRWATGSSGALDPMMKPEVFLFPPFPFSKLKRSFFWIWKSIWSLFFSLSIMNIVPLSFCFRRTGLFLGWHTCPPVLFEKVRSIGEEARTLRCAALVAESIQMELCPGKGFPLQVIHNVANNQKWCTFLNSKSKLDVNGSFIYCPARGWNYWNKSPSYHKGVDSHQVPLKTFAWRKP